MCISVFEWPAMVGFSFFASFISTYDSITYIVSLCVPKLERKWNWRNGEMVPSSSYIRMLYVYYISHIRWCFLVWFWMWKSVCESNDYARACVHMYVIPRLKIFRSYSVLSSWWWCFLIVFFSFFFSFWYLCVLCICWEVYNEIRYDVL